MVLVLAMVVTADTGGWMRVAVVGMLLWNSKEPVSPLAVGL